jgi:hypothetical protein
MAHAPLPVEQHRAPPRSQYLNPVIPFRDLAR